jgi:hypothetical protein
VCPTKALHIVESEEVTDLIAKRRHDSGIALMTKG